jgi:outer membrane protein assembly factor BamB
MPVDLDDLFLALGRQADAVPLAPAAAAVQRGRRRTRMQAVVSAAAVVCLLTVGVALAVRPDRHDDRRRTPVAPRHALTDVGAPIAFGGPLRDAETAIAAGRVYAAWQTVDGVIRVLGADLRTGTVAWPARSPGRTGELGALEAVPQALLITVAPEGLTKAGRVLYVYDPADGRLRWQLPMDDADDLVVHERALVRMVAATGRTEALNWSTGAKRWSLPGTGDQPVRTMGMRVPADDPGAGFTDDRLVQVTKAGRIQVRDVDTGALHWTAAGTVTGTDGLTSYHAYDGWLYDDERANGDAVPYRVRATDLRSDHGDSLIVREGRAGHSLGMVQPCGSQRVCVLDQDGDRHTVLTAIDVLNHRQWQVAGPDGGDAILALHGYTLVSGGDGANALYDSEGEQVFHSPDAAVAGWLDANILLVLPPSVATPGPVGKVDIAGRRLTPLGERPPVSGPCAWTADRLACPTTTSLRIWSLSG